MKKFIKLSAYILMVIASWFTSQSKDWDTTHEQIVIVTSVISAASFVRLNRSLPVLHTDFLFEGQLTRITDSYKTSSQALGVHAVVAVVTLGYSILLLTPLNFISTMFICVHFLPELFLCLLFGHVLIRSVDIIYLDLDFTKLQSDLLMERAGNSTNLSHLSNPESIAKELDVPEGYGDVINDLEEEKKG